MGNTFYSCNFGKEMNCVSHNSNELNEAQEYNLDFTLL